MKKVNKGIDPHPHDAVPEAHDRYAFFWEVQNRRGVPSFVRDVYGWDELSEDFEAQVKARTKRNRAIYVGAYDFGKYPEIYAAMQEAGARVIPLNEAEDLVRSGKTIPGVPGANG
jgi:hypothetical protein